ncbi:putative spermidine/putrescine transport system permease protein [Evansella caseinilytica]|uniref:Putative spermidine/putrescine transport system permease protein n=1 Tax=Evansella caseinilytica TaxID=1503961 RepID=A0A1H3UKN4_9BACI|nr:ABC transporter permease subunit [Evansella caseinilytica]SDZ62907.1 putative spermidine/putrescine transport system permease protein [Evansella caseinilytica]
MWYFKALPTSKIIQFICLSVFLIFFFGPLLNLLLLAFSGEWQYPHRLPTSWSLEWWSFVLQDQSITRAMGLSFLIATIVTLLSLIICLPAAYTFARIQFPMRRFFLFSYLLTNAFPKMGLYVAIAVLFYRLGLMNTFVGIVLIHIINTLMFMTWIPSAAFANVHQSQEESARDAGASPFQVFWHITLPMAKPGIIVASVFTFLSSLDEAQGTFLVGIPDYRTMPVIMYSIIVDYPSTAGAVFSVILTAPTIILLLVARKFVGGDALAAGFKMK